MINPLYTVRNKIAFKKSTKQKYSYTTVFNLKFPGKVLKRGGGGGHLSFSAMELTFNSLLRA